MATDFNINIIDTFENNRSVLQEKTAVESPRLIYNGSEDKFTTFFTSELHFNMLVTSGVSAAFLHLFTGNEKRYKVQLLDSTDVSNQEIVWEGYLLPEQFSEPYENSAFLVEFVAVDGIGLLKTKYLADDFYTDKKTITEILAACLSETALSYPLAIAPAIQNTIMPLKQSELAINTACYNDDGKKQPVYDILEALVKSMRCKLFQYAEKWYVVGINRFPESELVVENYTALGVYIDTTSVFRNVIDKKFYASPSITIASPLQSVAVTWEKDAKKYVLPEDLVTYLPASLTNKTSKYFKTVGTWTDQVVGMYSKVVNLDLGALSVAADDLHSYYTQPNVPNPNLFLNPDNYYLSISGYAADIAALSTRYISITDAFFVKKDMDLTLSIKFELTNFTTTSEEVKTMLDATPGYGQKYSWENSAARAAQTGMVDLDFGLQRDTKDVYQYDGSSWVLQLSFYENFFWAITYKEHQSTAEADETFVVTNLPETNKNNKVYDYKLRHFDEDDFGYFLKGELEVKQIKALKAGYYNLRLYPKIGSGFTQPKIIFTQVELTGKEEKKEELIKNRDIDYTTTKDVTVFHSDSEMNLTNRQLLIDDAVVVAVNYTTPEGLYAAPQLSYTHQTNSPYSNWETLTIKLDLTDQVLIDALISKQGVFVKKAGTNLLTALEYYYAWQDATGVYVFQSFVDGLGNGTYPYSTLIAATDEIWIQIDAFTLVVDYAGFLQEKWKRYGVDEEIRYLEAQNRITHDCLEIAKFGINGTVLTLINPLDLLSFNYVDDRNYIPVRLEQNLTDGTTQVDMIEVSTSKVTDYVD